MYYLSILRSAAVESQPVMMSQLSGSGVSSITRVSTRRADQKPTLWRLASVSRSPDVLDDHVLVRGELRGLRV